MADLGFIELLFISLAALVGACLLGCILFRCYESWLYSDSYEECQLSDDSAMTQARKHGVIPVDMYVSEQGIKV
jgi:hypothetical protein